MPIPAAWALTSFWMRSRFIPWLQPSVLPTLRYWTVTYALPRGILSGVDIPLDSDRGQGCRLDNEQSQALPRHPRRTHPSAPKKRTSPRGQYYGHRFATIEHLILRGAIVDDGVNATFTLATDALFARRGFWATLPPFSRRLFSFLAGGHPTIVDRVGCLCLLAEAAYRFRLGWG